MPQGRACRSTKIEALTTPVASTYPESHFRRILDTLEKRFPGSSRWSRAEHNAVST
jgi:hypothetical protein